MALSNFQKLSFIKAATVMTAEELLNPVNAAPYDPATNPFQVPNLSGGTTNRITAPVDKPITNVAPAPVKSNIADVNYDRTGGDYFFNYWKNAENSAGTGFNKSVSKWFPYNDPDGNAPAIGYGIKLNDPKRLQLANKGIDDATLMQWYNEERSRGDAKIRQHVDKTHGVGSYDKLNSYLKDAMLDIEMNTGNIAGWPMFISHAVNRRYDQLPSESSRSYSRPIKDKNGDYVLDAKGNKTYERIPLVRRNKAFLETFINPLLSESNK